MTPDPAVCTPGTALQCVAEMMVEHDCGEIPVVENVVSRPFSRDRSGSVLGAGARIYILEESEHARRRGAKIYAEITGCGSTCDAYHRVRLEGTGEESARAMSLADAGRAPGEIDYVNLHGTSTLLNDRIETQASKLAFNSHAARRRSRSRSCYG